MHTRVVRRHTCGRRQRCDCRPEPCHARRDLLVCPHGVRLASFARHAETDKVLGTPMCLDCYDHAAQAVWNLMAGELFADETRMGLRPGGNHDEPRSARSRAGHSISSAGGLPRVADT